MWIFLESILASPSRTAGAGDVIEVSTTEGERLIRERHARAWVGPPPTTADNADDSSVFFL